jgi:hypothetical protein
MSDSRLYPQINVAQADAKEEKQHRAYVVTHPQVAAAQDALVKAFVDSSKHPTEANGLIFLGCEMLDGLQQDKQLNESELATLFIGTLVVSLALSQAMAYRHDPAVGPLQFYPVQWADLYNDEAKLAANSVVYPTYEKRFAISRNFYPSNYALIKVTGDRIMSGALPLPASAINNGMPDIADHLAVVATFIAAARDPEIQPLSFPEIFVPYRKPFKSDLSVLTDAFQTAIKKCRQHENMLVEDKFRWTDVIPYCKDNVTGQPKTGFITALRDFSNAVLYNFEHRVPGYNFETCEFIATKVIELADKVGLQTLTKADCDKFDEETRYLRTDKLISVALSTLIFTAILVSVSIALTLAVSGMPAAILAGGIAGMIGLGSSYSFFQKKRSEDLQIQLVNNADEVAEVLSSSAPRV